MINKLYSTPMTDYRGQKFDFHMQQVPDRFKDPTVEVMDTADSVRIWLTEFNLLTPELLLELTKLILDRVDAE